MTIEIHNAELERLLEERLKEQRGSSVEDILLSALKSSPPSAIPPEPAASDTLVAFFRRSPLVGLELEFERDDDLGRDVAL